MIGKIIVVVIVAGVALFIVADILSGIFNSSSHDSCSGPYGGPPPCIVTNQGPVYPDEPAPGDKPAPGVEPR
jgi:hypothetical protein